MVKGAVSRSEESMKFIDEDDYRGFYYNIPLGGLDLNQEYTYSAWANLKTSTGTNKPRILMHVEYNNGSSSINTGQCYAELEDGWQYLESKIDFSDYQNITLFRIYLLNGPYSASAGPYGEVSFDDVCFRPSDVVISTSTYYDSGLVSSITDDNQNTAFFTYDGAGRPTIVRDNEWNIVKAYNYNFGNQ